MKKLFSFLFFVFLFINGFGQDLAYEVRGKHGKPVTKRMLESSNSLSDLIPGYPTKWVKDYVKVELLAQENGNSYNAVGENEILNSDQKSILDKLNLDSELEVNVLYKNENSVTEQIDNRKMVVKMTVVPDIEAEFEGGYKNLKQYLKENLVSRITDNTPEEFQRGKVIFTINETGKVVDAEISESSGDNETDNFLLEILNNMPNWKPAQNADGVKVKQKFEFSMGIGGC